MTNSKGTIFFPPPLLPEAAGIFQLTCIVFLLNSDEIVLEFSSEFVSMLFY